MSSSDKYLLPALGFRGCPVGVHVGKALELGIQPQFNCGVPNKTGGMAGAGTAAVPRALLQKAADALELASK